MSPYMKLHILNFGRIHLVNFSSFKNKFDKKIPCRI